MTNVAWQHVGNYLSEEAGLLVANSSPPQVSSDDRLMADSGRKQHKYNYVSQLSPVEFSTIDCSLNDTVLLVSGGLTADAHQFAASLNGKLISFPTVAGKAVMNAAMSGSVALFEIARQLRLQAPCTLDAVN